MERSLTCMLSAANIFSNWENKSFSCERVCLCVGSVCLGQGEGGQKHNHSIHYTHYPVGMFNVL